MSSRHLLRIVPLLLVLLAIAAMFTLPLSTECSVEAQAGPGQQAVVGEEECRDLSLMEGETSDGRTIGYLLAAVIAAGLFALAPRQWVRALATAVLAGLAVIGLASVGWLLLPAVLACAVILAFAGTTAPRPEPP